MDIIKALKEELLLVQKSNDIKITQKIINVQQAILDMQSEMSNLKIENESLKSIKDLEKRIIRHKGRTYITLENDTDKIFYCSRCWDKERKLVQLFESKKQNAYSCPNQNCRNYGYINEKVYNDDENGEKITII